jgi:hypothetical protein
MTKNTVNTTRSEGEFMSESDATKPTKPFELWYYAAGWGGWRGLPLDTTVSDDPADFDTIEEGRVLALQVAQEQRKPTRIMERATGETVAEYRAGGRLVR